MLVACFLGVMSASALKIDLRAYVPDVDFAPQLSAEVPNLMVEERCYMAMTFEIKRFSKTAWPRM